MQSIFPSLALLVLSLSVAEGYCCHPSEDESSKQSYDVSTVQSYDKSSEYSYEEPIVITFYTTPTSSSPYSERDDDEDTGQSPVIVIVVILILASCRLWCYCRERDRRLREAEAIMHQRPTTVGSINQHFISTAAILGLPPYNTTTTFPRTVYTPHIPPTHTRTGPTFTPSTSTQYQPPIVPSRRETTPVVETNNERQLRPQQTALIVDPEGNVQVGIQDER